MNQDKEKEAYQEAGHVVAENRHPDNILLFDEFTGVFADDTAESLAEVDGHEEVEAAVNFVHDISQDDPTGEGLIDPSHQESCEPAHLAAASDDLVLRMVRAITVALIVLCILGAGGYFFLVRGGEAPRNGVEFGAMNLAPAPSEPSSQEVRSTPPETTIPGTNAASPKRLQTESRSGFEKTGEFPKFDTTAIADSRPTPVDKKEGIEMAEAVATPHGNAISPSITPPRPQGTEEVNGSTATTPAEALINIVQAKDLEAAVEFLRDNRALANALDHEKRPVLTYARSVEMAELLVEAGADYEASTAGGWTPLMWIAGRNGNPEIAKYLIELGAWVSIEDNTGTRPIHQAASTGNHELVSAFVDSGADINAIDDTHSTPLHRAAWAGDLDGVTLYLSLGADFTLQNKKGETPFNIARNREHLELLPFLDPDRTAMSGTDAPISASAQVGTAGTRELNFSDNVRLGTVQIRKWGSSDYKAWEPAGSAWGTVSVPVGNEVMLMVDMPRLDALKTIGPEGIQVLHIRDVELGDESLKNLYHLKGLQRLTLSRTDVSKAAVDALREALPECTIRH